VQAAQAELDKARQELAQRDAEARRLKMQQELSRVATTKSTERGLIVTLSSGILFDTGKMALKPGAKKTLTRIADQIKPDDSVRVTVEGHTDSVGTEEKNQQLSEKRANAVRDFLVSAGVAADRITATGLGETNPVATNKTAAGRQQNRRVELIITNR
jgi:outer membrane protein OmpA-like peptidoglycan-associated protein